MPDYAKTQIYKIISKDSNITNFYIGSTTNWTKRKQNHKNSCNNVNDKKYNLQVYQIIRQNGGFENFNMILIEDYPCENKRESEKREQYWKDLLKPDMNMINAFTMEFNININPEEYYKESYQINKDKINKYGKEYRKNNKDKMKELNKIYRETNKDKIKEYRKIYSEKNKEKKIEYDREYRFKKYICEYCNKELSLHHKSTHEKTLKHINNINLTKST